ncbi:MAG: orotidine 5'-phosphate decarboxylase [Candidatus Woesearchaeota archaeon]
MSFRESWLDAVKDKNSVLCAGLDPAVSEMDRGENGLPEDIHIVDWALDYVEAIAPYCAALKPNTQYWKWDYGELEEIVEIAQNEGLVVIEDAKYADIGSTNDAGLFYSESLNIDAVTYSPFAGNMKEAADQAHKRGLGLISMCLMSNPEYENEKNKLVVLTEEEAETDYAVKHLLPVGDRFYTRQFIKLAYDAKMYCVDGLVIGAPSPKNHLTDEEISLARRYAGENMLVLMPGVGAQGGEAEKIWKYFAPENVIVNVGRGLMFPNGSNTTPEQHAATAKQYQEMLNKLRGK